MSARPDHVDRAPVTNHRDIEPKTEDLDVDPENDRPKKKQKPRPTAKPLDKKFECSAEGCTKSYSRAEHLYRHQLNHTPKQIYHCDHPGCDRSFVRADLCTRHRERHTSKGSHLARREAFQNRANANNALQGSHSPTSSGAMSGSPPTSSHANGPTSRPDVYLPGNQATPTYTNGNDQYQTPGISEMSQVHSNTSMNIDNVNGKGNINYSTYAGQMTGAPGAVMPSVSSPNGQRRYPYDQEYTSAPNGYSQHQQPLTVNAMHQTSLPAAQSNANMYGQNQYTSVPTNAQQQYRAPMPYSEPTSAYGIQVSGYGQAAPQTSNGISDASLNPQNQYPMATSRGGDMLDFSTVDANGNFSMPTMPVFYDQQYDQSQSFYRPGGTTLMPLVDPFFSDLWETGGVDWTSQPSPPLAPEPAMNAPLINEHIPKLETEGIHSEHNTTGDNRACLSMNVDLDVPETAIDAKIQKRLIKLVSSFEEIEALPGRRPKVDIISGDTNDTKHALSIHMLKTALMSYWIHIHQQMPIMHQPTFKPSTCPDLLLMAMICLGGSCLERTHAAESAKNISELAFFAAYHIRWAVFKDAEFRTPAKLWTFQTMLLLELFEKMYSTRALHERAHIHHATTLTVMRRGQSLVGRALELPDEDDPTRTPPGPEGSINTSGQNTPDPTWNRWITSEATRRCAFASFIIDSTHATLFGHAAAMSVYDMRIPLPCDEAQWAATSGEAVQAMESSLEANGFKKLTFVEGIKKILGGHKVRTNTFGRVVLMAGLLNVSWHLNQRDLQVALLTAKDTLGQTTRWQSPMIRAIDFWKKDFDDSIAKSSSSSQMSAASYGKDKCGVDHRDNILESRMCLHSLAHMAMHIDIIECEMFAGAPIVLGREIHSGERKSTMNRILNEWAPSARGRDAVYHALRFLREVLVPEEALNNQRRGNAGSGPTFTYSARDDYLLNRPWILYFSCMIVWCYGFALDGKLKAVPNLRSRDSQIQDMQRYLIRLGGPASPEHLQDAADRNGCLGLLLVLRECFAQPRWELLQEARKMLGHCIDQLLPQNTNWREW